MSTSTQIDSMEKKPLKHLNRVAKKPALDIEFQDLKFSVRDNNIKGGWRQILHSVNGKFRCGELTAILGPNGAGKTTLLNILAGYVRSDVEGNIKLNDLPRDSAIFNKISSYVMQDNIVQPNLTVNEAMMYAATFKLGSHVKYQDKIAVIEEVIDLLGLEKCVDTYNECLSGGEKKRLNIALELVGNPSIIFLDEPTTGLDSFAMKQCISLLNQISKLNRTVVCTIHQPPASFFQYFNQLYIVAEGCCVYNGSPSQLVPFFSLVNVSCPSNNTPAEYMIELVHSNPSLINSFKTVTQNGKVNITEPSHSSQQMDIFQYEDMKNDIDFATPLHIQFYFLLSRMLKQMKRNRLGLFIQVLHHLLSAILLAAIFTDIGNDASKGVEFFNYCVSCNVLLMYTHLMLPVLLFPFEVQLIEREYFNRWYGLKAYYAALTVATFPLLLILTAMFSAIVYFMTDQPKETERFFGFYFISLFVALTSQGLGYMIGSVLNVTYGAIVGSASIAPLLALAVHSVGFGGTVKPFYKFMMALNYMRHGVVGLCNTLFYDRGPLNCPDDKIYCHYTRPDDLMSYIGVPLMDYRYQLGYIAIFLVIFRIAGYMCLKYKLNADFPLKKVYCIKTAFKLNRAKSSSSFLKD